MAARERWFIAFRTRRAAAGIVFGSVGRGLEWHENDAGVVGCDHLVELVGEGRRRNVVGPRAHGDGDEVFAVRDVFVGENLQADSAIRRHPEDRIGGHRHVVDPEFVEKPGRLLVADRSGRGRPKGQSL